MKSLNLLQLLYSCVTLSKTSNHNWKVGVKLAEADSDYDDEHFVMYGATVRVEEKFKNCVGLVFRTTISV